MALTPRTLPRHELTGLPARVVDSSDTGRVGTAGRVVRETTKTLTLATSTGPTCVPKSDSTFAFRIAAVGVGDDAASDYPDADAGASSSTAVVVDGDRLIARPARRTETGARPSWH